MQVSKDYVQKATRSLMENATGVPKEKFLCLNHLLVYAILTANNFQMLHYSLQFICTRIIL
jgi:hypothetical protein